MCVCTIRLIKMFCENLNEILLYNISRLTFYSKSFCMYIITPHKLIIISFLYINCVFEKKKENIKRLYNLLTVLNELNNYPSTYMICHFIFIYRHTILIKLYLKTSQFL